MIDSRCRSGAAVALCCVLAVFGLAACSKSGESSPQKTVEVGIVTLHASDLTVTTDLAGRAKTRTVAEIRPQVGGIIKKRAFTEGAMVQAGQLLYELDTTTYKAAYDSAQASVTKAQATLRSTEVTAKRKQALAKIEAVSQQDADDAVAAFDEAKASLGVAKADLEAARVNLEHTRITSPISGRTDLSVYSQGALVTASQDAALTTVRQMDPLVVDVTQSSVDILKLRRAVQDGILHVDSQGTLPVKIVLEDGSVYDHPAQLQFSGVSVDEGTGMVTLRAVVPNPEGVLMPGMYLRAVVGQGTVAGAILAPQQAVTRNSSGAASVLVLKTDNTIERRKVKLGDAVGNQWQVLEGLSDGERLVVQGLQKVRVGDHVSAVEIDLKTGAAAQGHQSAAKPKN